MDRTKLKAALDTAALIDWLNKQEISVRRDVVRHRIEVQGLDEAFDRETLDSTLHVILHDALRRDFSCTPGQVADLLSVVAGLYRFNPVLEYLARSPQWDGRDRYEDIFDLLCIADDDDLSRVLVKKWLWQTMSLLHNDTAHPFGADGMLTLLGRQGLGKTRFCEIIAIRPDFVHLGGYLDFRDKDTVIRSTGAWITELGELETTLRTDGEKLKAFITSATDSFRLPYARADSHLLRRTSFIATANTERLLVDPTGSRRFWVIPLEHIDLHALENLDVVQLWRQVQHDVDRLGVQSFRLTPDEQRELAIRNGQHERPLKAQSEIEDIIAVATADPSGWVYEYQTVTRFKESNPCLHAFSAETIGRALDRLGIQQEKPRIDGKKVRARLLPCRRC